MTLKKNQRHLVSFILFVYHVIEVCEYEWWVFSAEKQQQFIVSFPVCFTKTKTNIPYYNKNDITKFICDIKK